MSAAAAAIGAGGSLLETMASGAYGLFAADQNRDFQRDMANTAVQRQVKDMKQAGINPILAAKYGGAATPPGAVAPTPQIDATAKGIQAAQAKANIDNVNANTLKAEAEAKLAQISADTESSLTVERLIARRAELSTMTESYGLTQDKRSQIYKMLEHIDAQIEKLSLESEHSALGLEKAEKDASFWQGKGGTLAPYLRELIGPSAKSARDIIGAGFDAYKKVNSRRRPPGKPQGYQDGATSDANEAAYWRSRYRNRN